VETWYSTAAEKRTEEASKVRLGVADDNNRNTASPQQDTRQCNRQQYTSTGCTTHRTLDDREVEKWTLDTGP